MIVIGDVHGEYNALIRLLAKLPNDKLCFAGDMIDRGLKSCQVLEYVIENGHDAVKGNHEYMFYESPRNRDLDRVWTNHGKKVCLDSFNGDEAKLIKYRKWAKELPLYKEYKDCQDDEGRYLVVSHTGINYTWEYADPHCSENDYFGYTTLWENDFRRMKDREDIDYDFYNIFGHSPQRNEPFIGKAYACVDGGGFIKDKPGYGRLTAIQFPSLEVWEESTIGG